MFNIFKASESQQVEKCEHLGKGALIEPLIENCHYCGFIVEVHGYQFEEFCRCQGAREAFMRIVDRRIREQDFSFIYIHPASSELDSSHTPRVVFDSRGKVLMSWAT